MRCRQVLVDHGYTRKTVNQHISRVRRVFKWGVAEGLVEVSTWQALLAVEGLRYGEAKRESRKIRPADEDRVEAVRSHVTPPVWTMIQLQLWTGMRPGEVRQMRTCDIVADDPALPPSVRGMCWVYRPASHKTEHHERSRLILLGPHAQEILQPWLRPNDLTAHLFSPTEGRQWWLNKKRGSGKHPNQKDRRKPGAKQPHGTMYTKTSYRHSIKTGCELAFGMPAHLRRIRKKLKDGTPVPVEELTELRRQAREWRKQHCWHPHQLRHTAATKIRKAYGIEIARIILGHAHVSITEIYAERDLEAAAKAMAAIG